VEGEGTAVVRQWLLSRYSRGNECTRKNRKILDEEFEKNAPALSNSKFCSESKVSSQSYTQILVFNGVGTCTEMDILT
jgi:hypothetical protein